MSDFEVVRSLRDRDARLRTSLITSLSAVVAFHAALTIPFSLAQESSPTPNPLPVWGLSFSPDSALLAAAVGVREADGAIIVWNTSDWSDAFRLPEESAPTCVAFSRDGKALLAGSQRGSVMLIDVHARSIARRWESEQQAINGAAWTPDSQLILTAGGDGTIRVWDAGSGELRKTLDTWAADAASRPEGAPEGDAQGGERLIWDVAVTRDGMRAVTGGWGDTTRLWDLETGALLQSYAATDQSVQGVAFTPDGRHFVCNTMRNGVVYVRETDSGLERAALRNYSGRDVAVHPGGTILAAASGADVRVFTLNLALPDDAEVERYQQIIARLEDDDVRVRDAASAEILQIGLPIEPLLFASLQAPGAETRIRCRRLWNQIRASEPVATLKAGGGEVRQVAFSPDGKLLAAATKDGELRVWEVPGFDLRRVCKVTVE